MCMQLCVCQKTPECTRTVQNTIAQCGGNTTVGNPAVMDSDVIVYSSFLLWPGVSHCITCPIVHTICNLACSHEADPQTILSVFIICQGILVSVLTFQ